MGSRHYSSTTRSRVTSAAQVSGFSAEGRRFYAVWVLPGRTFSGVVAGNHLSGWVRYYCESSATLRMSQLMRLMAQCCQLGLALLVFIALHLFEKHTSMGMEAAPLLTSVGAGAAAAATKAQWDTRPQQDLLEKLASNERWIALPASYKRAAGEIYHLMRSAGHATVRGWFAVPGLRWALTHDDMLEGLFRQLSAAREFQLTGDAAAASRILAFRSANESALPSWLQTEARRWSDQVRKQGLRGTAPKENARAKPFEMKTSDAADGTVR
ncbi:unnamed protein product [Polarella glacialis]|uniref:Uncharacterized protein n=1 Tax=Polarella glacialis TaxID=89957 RepID=A0A813M086_POLGL|nr:unnamed protein product [Polarella glacialis]